MTAPEKKVTEWLLEIGVGADLAQEYSRLLHNHHVTMEILPLVTVDQLEKIGIKSIGHQILITTKANPEKNGISEAKKIDKAVEYIKSVITGSVPEFGIVAGTGLEGITNKLSNKTTIPFKDIPHFPLPSLKNQKDYLAFGTLKGKSVAVLAGGVHHYEGVDSNEILFGVRVLKKWGIKNLIITSTCGSLKASMKPSDLVFFEDHINLIPNPLIGLNLSSVHSWRHGKEPYKKKLLSPLLEIASKHNITAHKGVYLAVTGPSGSTRAELNAWVHLGADVIGYSCAPEVVGALELQLPTFAIGVISDMCVPDVSEEVTEEICLKAVNEGSTKLINVLEELVCLEDIKEKKGYKAISERGPGLVLVGNRAYHEQNYLEALQHYKEALKLETGQPAVWNIHNRLCATYTRLGDHLNALNEASMMIKERPDHAKGYVRRGGAYYFLDDNEKALADYKTALKIMDEDNDKDTVAKANLERYIEMVEAKLKK